MTATATVYTLPDDALDDPIRLVVERKRAEIDLRERELHRAHGQPCRECPRFYVPADVRAGVPLIGPRPLGLCPMCQHERAVAADKEARKERAKAAADERQRILDMEPEERMAWEAERALARKRANAAVWRDGEDVPEEMQFDVEREYRYFAHPQEYPTWRSERKRR